jgi:hypothetical protein
MAETCFLYHDFSRELVKMLLEIGVVLLYSTAANCELQPKFLLEKTGKRWPLQYKLVPSLILVLEMFFCEAFSLS